MAKIEQSRRSKTTSGGGGCIFLLLSSVIAGFLLVANGVLLGAVYPLVTRFGPLLLSDPRLRQGVLFVGPVLLLVLEWWLIDMFVDWRDRRSLREEQVERE